MIFPKKKAMQKMHRSTFFYGEFVKMIISSIKRSNVIGDVRLYHTAIIINLQKLIQFIFFNIQLRIIRIRFKSFSLFNE